MIASGTVANAAANGALFASPRFSNTTVPIRDEPGPFCFGDAPTLADLCLVPQLANARRFGVDVSAYPRLLKAEAAAKALPAFANAAPEKQPDAE